MHETAQKIYRHLTTAKRIVIVPHPNPDEDALGSVSAMAEHLSIPERRVTVFCSTPLNTRLNFLPNIPKITIDAEIFSDPFLDTVILMDCGDPRYAGVDKFIKNHPATIINIDHHATNENFGHYNLVIKNASSTAEIVFNYFEANRLPMTRHIATNLLAGIISDTGNFTNGATTPSAMAIAGELVRRGANFKLINFFTQKDKTFNLLRLWGAALSRLAKLEEIDLIYTYLKRTDYEICQLADTDAGDGLSDFMNNLEGAKITLILKETTDGKIKGSFRTTRDNVDVSAMAKQLGGGGHKKAAGFTVEGTIEDALNKILNLKNSNV